MGTLYVEDQGVHPILHSYDQPGIGYVTQKIDLYELRQILEACPDEVHLKIRYTDDGAKMTLYWVSITDIVSEEVQDIVSWYGLDIHFADYLCRCPYDKRREGICLLDEFERIKLVERQVRSWQEQCGVLDDA